MYNLPKYKSHKVVGAAKIAEINGPFEDSCIHLHFEDKSIAPIRLPINDYYTKHKPKAGGYFIEYEDGYISWSPADVFESGYIKENMDINPLTIMSKYPLVSIFKKLKESRLDSIEQKFIQDCINQLYLTKI